MKQIEIHEGDQLIATFMLNHEKFKMTHCIGIENGLYQTGDPSDKIPYFHDINLEYLTSWDWLIPVVTKITTLCAEKLSDSEYEAQWRYFFDYQSYKFFVGNIESIWKAVVEFITWYNTQNNE